MKYNKSQHFDLGWSIQHTVLQGYSWENLDAFLQPLYL